MCRPGPGTSHPPLESPEAGSGLPPTEEGRGVGRWPRSLGGGSLAWKSRPGRSRSPGCGSRRPRDGNGEHSERGVRASLLPSQRAGHPGPRSRAPLSPVRSVSPRPPARSWRLNGRFVRLRPRKQKPFRGGRPPPPLQEADCSHCFPWKLGERGARREPRGEEASIMSPVCARPGALGRGPGSRRPLTEPRVPAPTTWLCPHPTAGGGGCGAGNGETESFLTRHHRQLRALSEPSRSGSAARPRGGHARP